MGGFEFPENQTYTTHDKDSKNFIVQSILDMPIHDKQIQPIDIALSSKQMSAIKECQLPEMEQSPCKIPKKDLSSLSLKP